MTLELIDIESIEYVGEEEVYDLEVENDHSYIANDIVIHNCKHSKPNTAQFPSHGEEAEWFSPIISKPKDYFKFKLDYSGFQIRIGGILSGDENLIDAYKHQGGDVHSMMARILYTPDLTLDQFMQVKKNEPYKDYRFKAKCFKKGTLIETNKGAVRVEDFVPEVNKGYLTPFIGDLKLKDRFGNIKDIKGTIYEESLEMFRFELENGDTFEVTPEHRFKILREGKEIEVLAKDVLDADEFISL